MTDHETDDAEETDATDIEKLVMSLALSNCAQGLLDGLVASAKEVGMHLPGIGVVAFESGMGAIASNRSAMDVVATVDLLRAPDTALYGQDKEGEIHRVDTKTGAFAAPGTEKASFKTVLHDDGTRTVELRMASRGKAAAGEWHGEEAVRRQMAFFCGTAAAICKANGAEQLANAVFQLFRRLSKRWEKPADEADRAAH